MAKSHYLEKDRLANVIAAIQIMAVADRPSGTLNRWVAELEASEELTAEQLDNRPSSLPNARNGRRCSSSTRSSSRPTPCGASLRVLLRWRYAESIKNGASGNGSPSDDKTKQAMTAEPRRASRSPPNRSRC